MKKTMIEHSNAKQNLQAGIEQLSKEITPERDLWIGIEKAINQHSTTTKNQIPNKVFIPAAWVASVTAAVLLTWQAMAPESLSHQASINVVDAIQQDFQQQKQVMLVSFGAPDIKQLSVAMQTELVKLSSAQKTIIQALSDDPNNTDLINLLRWTQQQELDLLKQLYSPQWQSI